MDKIEAARRDLDAAVEAARREERDLWATIMRLQPERGAPEKVYGAARPDALGAAKRERDLIVEAARREGGATERDEVEAAERKAAAKVAAAWRELDAAVEAAYRESQLKIGAAEGEIRKRRRDAKLASQLVTIRALVAAGTLSVRPCDRDVVCEELGRIIVLLDEKRRAFCEDNGLAEDHPLAISVFLVSEGGLNDLTNTVEGEGDHSAVKTRGRGGRPSPPGVHWGPNKDDLTDDQLLREYGHGERAFEVMNAELTSLLAKLVEKGLHWLVELLAPHLRLQPLWCHAGAGCLRSCQRSSSCSL